jgi:hypothetical protein
MVHVVSHADQADTINAALPNHSYHCTHILVNGESSLSENKSRTALNEGTQEQINYLVAVPSKEWDIAERVIFKDHCTVFGYKVYSHPNFSYSFLLNIFLSAFVFSPIF